MNCILRTKQSNIILSDRWALTSFKSRIWDEIKCLALSYKTCPKIINKTSLVMETSRKKYRRYIPDLCPTLILRFVFIWFRSVPSRQYKTHGIVPIKHSRNMSSSTIMTGELRMLINGVSASGIVNLEYLWWSPTCKSRMQLLNLVVSTSLDHNIGTAQFLFCITKIIDDQKWALVHEIHAIHSIRFYNNQRAYESSGEDSGWYEGRNERNFDE